VDQKLKHLGELRSIQCLWKLKLRNNIDIFNPESPKRYKNMVTIILLNWKRSENLKEIIKSLRSQTVPVEIFLWNNNKEDTYQYDVDLQINSSKNLMCWPRWFLTTYTSNEYIAVMDDDIIMKDDNVLGDCLEYVNRVDVGIGYTGVILNDDKNYWKSKHVLRPDRDNDLSVDIIKGRFMFLKKSLIGNVEMIPKIIHEDNRIEDDILISSKLKNKIIPKLLHNRFKDLKSNDALYSQKNHKRSRTDVTNLLFGGDIAFMCIPKNACMCLSQFTKINNIKNYSHNRGENKSERRIKDLKSHGMIFCVLRDPVDRVISAYNYLSKGGMNGLDEKDWRDYCSNYSNLEDFILHGLELARDEQIHFHTQSSWLVDENDNIPKSKIEFINFINLEKEIYAFSKKYGFNFLKLEKINSSIGGGVELSENCLNKIRSLYEEDYNLISEVL